MRTKKINSRDFDFNDFVETIVSFIEANFLLDSPDAADTMRYFHSFQVDPSIGNIATHDKDFEKWQMIDFKNAVLQGGETIFFPFSGSPDLDGTINLASDETIQLSENGKENIPRLGLTDCFGLLVSLEKDKFVFRSAVAWGDMSSSIEEASHPKIDKAMNGFLRSFNRKALY